MIMKKLLFLAIVALFSVSTAQAQRVADKLTRGLVAIPQGDKTGQDDRYGVSGVGMFVSWRKLATEYYDTQYNLYRDGTKLNATPLSVTNYQDNAGKATNKYKVVPVVKGVERTDLASAEVTPWAHQYWDIPAADVYNRAGVNVTSQYSLNDCSVADVDGDGEMEFVVKRRNDSGLNTEDNTTTFNRHECYKMDGTLLWYIDMGPNLMAGPDEQFDLILYDWDQDGKAEALMRGADNMIIHTKSGKDIRIGDMTYYAPRSEYTHEGAEYLLYMNGETGEPYAWDGSDNWTPAAYPLPRLEQGESSYTVWGSADTGHRSCKHYFGAPYLDGRNASIFLGRGCYTRHKFCALDVDKQTHQLTQRWRWNCYDSSSPWFGNGFHNFAIADVDMDGRDEIVFGSMIIDDTGFGLSTTGYGHGDAQHCGDLDPYRWGLEQFVCLEGANVPGIAYTDGMSSTLRYTTGTGGDNGRCMAGNFQNSYPGAVGISLGIDAISLVADKVIGGVNYSNMNFVNVRLYWDGDLLDEFMDSPGTARSPFVYKAPGQTEVHTGRGYANNRCWGGSGNLNNSSKNNASFVGDILGDWREEIVNPVGKALRINVSSYESPWGITTLWADHEYRNGMTWQSVGYNQPPHVSFFLGELEGITKEPPAWVLEGRTEVANGGTIATTDNHLLVSGYENKTISVADGASPYILTVNAPAWVKGSGAQQAISSTPKQPARTIETYTTTLTGGAFSGATRLVKQGEGILVLPNVTEKHTGATDIWNGTLQFDGTMETSPVWLNRHTTLISEGGKFLGGLKADYNATIYPGGKNKVGAVTASKLELGFGARVVFDVNGATFDQLNATTLALEDKTSDDVWVKFGPRYKSPVFEFAISGEVQPGTYDLGAVDALTGSLNEVIVEGFPTNRKTTLVYADKKLQIVVEEAREASTAVWNGTADNTIWQQAVSENFLIDGVATYSTDGDKVVFNDDAATTSVQIRGAVSPSEVVFNNATKTYIVSGDSIVGGAPITKNEKGLLTLNNINHSGNTVINGGTLVAALLANNSGQTWGSLGDVSKTITLNDGATLRTNGVIITDQRLNIDGDVCVDVPSGKSVIFNKGIRGAGATLSKTGAGSMEMSTETNTFGKLIIKAGTMTSNYASNYKESLPPTVEFQGGTLWAANNEGTNINNSADFIVPTGKTGTLYGGYRSTYTGSLTGGGTFNVYTGGVRFYLDGDWSEFTGTVVAGMNNRQNKKSYNPVWEFRNANGLPNATLNVQDKVQVSNSGKDIELGSLKGTGYLVGSGKWILNNAQNLTLSTIHVGVPAVFNPGLGDVAVQTSPLVKRGAGKLTLSTLGNINGPMTIEEGTVTFNDSKLATYVNGSNLMTINGSGRVVGQGLIRQLVMNEGAELVPCGSAYIETTPGTIQTMARTVVRQGAVVNYLIRSTTSQSKLLPYTFEMNGTVKVTLVNGYVPAAGDEFVLWETTNTYSGTPSFDLPDLPEGLYWDVAGVAQKNGVLRITTEPTGIGRMASDAEVKCEVFTLSGAKVASFTSTKGAAADEARRQGLQNGTFIIKMRDGWRSEAQKVVVR